MYRIGNEEIPGEYIPSPRAHLSPIQSAPTAHFETAIPDVPLAVFAFPNRA